MSPSRIELLIPLIIVSSLFVITFYLIRKKIERFVSLTWFKRRTTIYNARKLLYMLGIVLLLMSLLDFRGPEEKIESDIPDQKTIVIIDSSASMLAEDVRPNRFKKSLIMARHFVKKAFGHKIAVVLFSDQQKRLVPFTDDLDLLDARISGLETIDLQDGGSNISQAIKESLGYFKSSKTKEEGITGNILVFTDSEGHDEDFTFSLPKGITLGVVGVGTVKGAQIPLRDKRGVFRGYKKFNNKEVISKLNEDWLKSLESKVPNYKYWVANSYTIPTDELMSFFNSSFNKRISKGLTTVRPVEVEYILIPSMFLLIISFMLYPLKNFKFVLLVFFFTASIPKYAEAQEESGERQLSPAEMEQMTKVYEQLESLMVKHKEGLLTNKEKMRMAELLTQNESYEMADTLYKESYKEMSYRNKNNYAINLIKNKQAEMAIAVLSDLQLELSRNDITDEELKKTLRQNILLALAENKKQKQEKKDQEKKEKEQEEKDKKKQKQGESGEGKSKKGSKGEQKPSDKEEDKEKKKKDSEKNKKTKEEKDNQKEAKPKSLKEKQKDIERKRKMVKIPGLIKQLMSDDRDLQKKYIDTSTDKPKSFKKKDW